METKTIKWKKGFFSRKYELLSNTKVIGNYNLSTFSSSSNGTLNKTKIQFKKKSFFNSNTDIIDLNLNKKIGSIKFNIFKSKTNISTDNSSFTWENTNFWQSTWSISQNGKPLINYKKSNTKGEIISNINNDTVLLCGLFIYNYYTKLLIIISSISTTIIISGN